MAKFTAQAQNDAVLSVDDPIVMGDPGNKHFKVKYKSDGTAVTNQVTNGGYDLGPTDPGEAHELTVVVRVVRGTRAGKHLELPITASSQALPQRNDTVVAAVTAK